MILKDNNIDNIIEIIIENDNVIMIYEFLFP